MQQRTEDEAVSDHGRAFRFWSTVDFHGPAPDYAPALGPCWLWTGHLQHHGYPQRMLQKTQWQAYRLAWVFFRGPIPEGLEIDHLCRVRRCVRPSHLEPVTKAENIRRSWAARLPTACRRAGHPYTPENTRMRRGARLCRTCLRADKRRDYERKRAAA